MRRQGPAKRGITALAAPSLPNGLAAAPNRGVCALSGRRRISLGRPSAPALRVTVIILGIALAARAGAAAAHRTAARTATMAAVGGA